MAPTRNSHGFAVIAWSVSRPFRILSDPRFVAIHAVVGELLPFEMMVYRNRTRDLSYEPLHSDALAFLFDPSMPHGMGARFLTSLAAQLNSPFEASMGTRVLREAVGPDMKRLDILVVDSANRAGLLIENKVLARESLGQLVAYSDAFQAQYPGFTPHCFLLTPRGTPPSAEALAHGWKAASYGDILAALRTSALGTSAPASSSVDVFELYARLLKRYVAIDAHLHSLNDLFGDYREEIDTYLAALASRSLSETDLRFRWTMEFLAENAPHPSTPIKLEIRSVLNEFDEFAFDSFAPGAMIVRFSPRDWTWIHRGGQWPGSESGLLLLFELKAENGVVNLRLYISPTADPTDRQTAVERRRLYDAAVANPAMFEPGQFNDRWVSLKQPTRIWDSTRGDLSLVRARLQRLADMVDGMGVALRPQPSSS